MALTRDAPSSNAFSPFYCERAVITDVNRANWTCSLQTIHSQKSMRDVQWASPYHHYRQGEGFHFMPEPGAYCFVAMPVDGSPAFVMSFVAPPAQKEAVGDDPVRATNDPAGSSTDVSYQSNRLDLNPGDIALTTRDENFLILRRGGIVQLGATPLAQRVMIPVRNFVRDFAENYEMVTPAGEVSWIIDRPEFDPAGKAPCSWSFQLREFATDEHASVQVRHLPLSEAGTKKAAWEVTVAPQSIDTETGAATTTAYKMLIATDGEKTEYIGADRTVTIDGNNTVTVLGDQAISVTGSSLHTANNIALDAQNTVELTGDFILLGGSEASQPAVLGNALVQWLSTVVINTVKGGPGTISPASLAQLTNILSTTVLMKP
jgi:hypothetical protein